MHPILNSKNCLCHNGWWWDHGVLQNNTVYTQNTVHLETENYKHFSTINVWNQVPPSNRVFHNNILKFNTVSVVNIPKVSFFQIEIPQKELCSCLIKGNYAILWQLEFQQEQWGIISTKDTGYLKQQTITTTGNRLLEYMYKILISHYAAVKSDIQITMFHYRNASLPSKGLTKVKLGEFPQANQNTSKWRL